VPTIETLSLVGLGLHIIESSAPIPPFPQRLHSWNVGVVRGAGLLFEHLISLPTILPLRSLELIEIMEAETYTAITRYLQHAGATLQSLLISLWDNTLGVPLLLSLVTLSQSLISESFAKRVIQPCTDLRRLSVVV
jgi:hypothetical protein